MEICKETKTALHQMIRHSTGITPKEIADLTGDSHNTICNYANMNMPDHMPSLKKFEAMLMFTQNPAVLKVWAHKLGFVLVPVGADGERHREMNVLEAMMLTNVASGKANQKVYEVLEDNIVTPQEYEEAHIIFQRIIECATAADKALQKQAEKYISVNQKEKA
ncbi:XRE family transcriptional regulator [Acinetobacter wuhouensis]|uniref:phage regulatory CII family protein n=1 Tax=Acinetobacter TaxID=469 RepID=UPI00083A268E|nr:MULTISPECIES: phage regulatory CII family protein [Acinetobacter]AXQ22602.1 XRE family transcriptional regulator [Acinetobacter wuhouensis]RZG76825.1 XRE family transcriptional regulator [Acinetobacter sp. WCHAc060033]